MDGVQIVHIQEGSAHEILLINKTQGLQSFLKSNDEKNLIRYLSFPFVSCDVQNSKRYIYLLPPSSK